MLTSEQLEEIRQRCDKATTGPWTAHGEHRFVHQDGGKYRCICEADTFLHSIHGYENPTFIAHAREDVPALLDHIQEQDVEMTRLRASYHRLLLAHLRVMRHDKGLYDAGGYKTSADLLRQMADQGLFEITVNGPENRIMGRLTPEGEKIMAAQSAEGA